MTRAPARARGPSRQSSEQAIAAPHQLVASSASISSGINHRPSQEAEQEAVTPSTSPRCRTDRMGGTAENAAKIM